MNYEDYYETTFNYDCDVTDGLVIELIKSPRPKDRLTKRPCERVKGTRSGWQVHKFGGSSFASPECYSFIGGLIDSFQGKNLIVVSALSGITNLLYSLCTKAETGSVLDSQEWKTLEVRISSAITSRLGNTFAREKELQRLNNDLLYLASLLSFLPSSSLKDRHAITQVVVGYGEIFSARLLTQLMRLEFQRSAVFMDARDVLVVQPLPGDAIEVCWQETRAKLKEWWVNRKPCDAIIVTGFIARGLEDDFPVTLKRNGSDFSATIFAVLSKAQSVTVWKDVDGMYTADPKKHADAEFIPYQSFEEAEEASLRGAFVLQKDCIEPVRKANIPIFLRNCFNLACAGTRIGPPEYEYSDSSSNLF